MIIDHDEFWEWQVDGARAVFTSREGGVSQSPFDSLNVGMHVGDDPIRVLENRQRAASLLGLTSADIAGVTQVHGADVWLDLASSEQLPSAVRWDDDEAAIEADALVSSRPGIALAIGTADCLPIAICWGGVIAAVHAGWRSLDAGVIEQAIAVLRRQVGSSVAIADVQPHAVIGPALGPCCMEVGDDVAARFGESFVIHREGSLRPHLDLRADAARRLARAGAVLEHIDICTCCDARLFSHRGDNGQSGRQALVVRRA